MRYRVSMIDRQYIPPFPPNVMFSVLFNKRQSREHTHMTQMQGQSHKTIFQADTNSDSTDGG